jgi:hypothetical protein
MENPALIILYLIVAGLSVNGIVEIWHTGSIFSKVRENLTTTYTSIDGGTWKSRRYELLLCPFCLSFWVSLFVLTSFLVGHLTGFPIHYVNLLFAVMRISNLINDYFKAYDLD